MIHLKIVEKRRLKNTAAVRLNETRILLEKRVVILNYTKPYFQII